MIKKLRFQMTGNTNSHFGPQLENNSEISIEVLD